MLSLLKIKNIALIGDLQIEFGVGLNLLTGETGSGKSIIVDSLGALTGDRVYSELIKEGEENARIEGIFSIPATADLAAAFDESGIDLENTEVVDLIIRRDIALNGRNRIFVNNQLVTQAFLKKIGVFLVDIHGQGEQATLFGPAAHLEMLDEYAGLHDIRTILAARYDKLSSLQREISALRKDEAHKLQLLDILQFQVDEIRRATLQIGLDTELEEEKRRLNNVEKLSTLSDEAYALLYENEEATVATLEKAVKRVRELAGFEPDFCAFIEGLETAQAVLEDLAFSVRDFRTSIEFSPERLEEIEGRLVDITGIKRKYGGSIESAIEHLTESELRLQNIETADLLEKELHGKLSRARAEFIETATELHALRQKSAKTFEKEIEKNLQTVALEKARFEVRIESPDRTELESAEGTKGLTAAGFDRIEFYFSANPGESVKPIGRVASGGELSRLMLTLKTTANLTEYRKAMVFDEIDAGIGGRVAEAVGLNLKELAKTQQVLCVTHQPQVASLADRHYLVEKETAGNRAKIVVRCLTKNETVEEIARMLAGEKITETARQHAREMLGK